MPTAILAPATPPRYLDARPLWLEPVPVDSAWRSPGFWAACMIVLPLAAVAAPVRALLRFL